MRKSFLTLFFALVALSNLLIGCVSNPVTLSPTNTIPSATPPGTSQPTPIGATALAEFQQGVVDGRAIAEKILGMVTANRAWLPPLSGGQPVRVLTDADKDNILKIANTYQPVLEAKQNSQVSKVDPRDYIWKSFTNESAVMVSNAYILQSGISQALSDYMGGQCYPGVFLIFRTQYERFAYAGMYLVVDLEREKVVYVEVFIEEAQFRPSADPYLESHNAANPLNSNYDPASKYGPEGSRFGPPWDRSPNLPTSQVTPT
jgi:hypothetical protein